MQAGVGLEHRRLGFPKQKIQVARLCHRRRARWRLLAFPMATRVERARMFPLTFTPLNDDGTRLRYQLFLVHPSDRSQTKTMTSTQVFHDHGKGCHKFSQPAG